MLASECGREQAVNKYIVTIRDGKTIEWAQLRICADDHEDAEQIGERLVKAIDPSAYVDAVHEAA
jgi:hypothetical protein